MDGDDTTDMGNIAGPARVCISDRTKEPPSARRTASFVRNFQVDIGRLNIWSRSTDFLNSKLLMKLSSAMSDCVLS